MILAVVVAFASGVLAVPAVRQFARATGAVAQPREQRWHSRPVPMLGGLAIVAAAWVVAAFHPVITPTLLPGTLMALVGLTDDFRHLKPRAKLGAQVAVALLSVWLISPPGITGQTSVDLVLTAMWIVALANAFNLIDNMDGLCAGVAAIVALGVVLASSTVTPAALTAGAVAGASAAFLLYNFHPASIFLGDSGSLFLGATVAVVAWGPVSELPFSIARASSPAVLLAVPLFDTFFVTATRWLARRPASQGGRDHTSHRLVALGFSDRDAVIVLYALSSAAAGAYYAVLRSQYDLGLLVPLLVVALLLVGAQLAGVAVYQGSDFAVLKESAYSGFLADLTFHRRIFEVLLDAILICIAYYGAYVLRFPDQLPTYLPFFWRSLPLVLPLQLLSFTLAGMYRSIWRYISLSDSTRYVKAVALAILLSVIGLVYTEHFAGYSRGVFIIDAMALLMLTVSVRLSFRWFAERAMRKSARGRPALLYGAGDGGALAVRELWNNADHGLHPVGFVDDDLSKRQKRVNGLPVLGGIADLRALIAAYRPEVVVITTPGLPSTRLQEIQGICFEAGVSLVRLTLSLTAVEEDA